MAAPVTPADAPPDAPAPSPASGDRAAPTPAGLVLRDSHIGMLLAAALLLTYAAVIVTPYAVTDDWVNFAFAKMGQKVSVAAIPAGRVIDGILVGYSFYWTPRLEDLRWLRLLGVLGIALLAWLLHRELSRAGWSRGRAACVAYLMCVTPAFQVCAPWTTMWPVFFSAAWAGLACHASRKAMDARGHLSRVLWSFGGALLLFLSVTVYQVTMMFYVVFAAIDLYGQGDVAPRFWRRFIWHSGFLIGGLFIGWLAFKIGFHYYYFVSDPVRTKVQAEAWGDKLSWFWSWPLRDTLQLLKVRPSEHLPLLSALFIFPGLFLFLRGALWQRGLLVLLAGVLIPVAYLPSLVANGRWDAYRTQMPMTALVLLYAFYALRGWARGVEYLLGRVGRQAWQPRIAAVTAVMLGLVAVGAAASAAYNVTTIDAEPQMTELRVMRREFRKVNWKAATKINIVGATWSDSLAWSRYDEWGLATSSREWALPHIAYVMAYESLGGKRPKIPIAVVKRGFKPPPGEWVIDMSGLRSFK
ncbi:MAG: hypothetical protein IT370_35765 [Deltaproteobacteria bacterium]|nr:hypothetical protein [Deltaproteobacteria bacterium]